MGTEEAEGAIRGMPADLVWELTGAEPSLGAYGRARDALLPLSEDALRALVAAADSGHDLRHLVLTELQHRHQPA